jgi:hypothetical protein
LTAAPVGSSLVAGFADRRAAGLTKHAGNANAHAGNANGHAGNANGVTVNSQGWNPWTKKGRNAMSPNGTTET